MLKMDGFSDFKAQFARLSRRLISRGRQIDEAEDAVQEAYVRLLGYVAKGEDVKEPEAFLTQVAYNIAADGRRRHGVRLKDPRPLEKLELLDSEPDPAESVAFDDFVRSTQSLLDNTVGDRARRVFFLRCYEGFTYAEISKQIGTTVRQVENDLVKAIKVLTKQEIVKHLR